MPAGGVSHHANALRVQVKALGVGPQKTNGSLTVVKGQGPLGFVGQAVVNAAHGVARVEQAVN